MEGEIDGKDGRMEKESKRRESQKGLRLDALVRFGRMITGVPWCWKGITVLYTESLYLCLLLGVSRCLSMCLFMVCSILLTYLLFVFPVVHVHVHVLSAVLSAIRHSPIGVPRPNRHSGGKTKKPNPDRFPAQFWLAAAVCRHHCIQSGGQSQPPNAPSHSHSPLGMAAAWSEEKAFVICE